MILFFDTETDGLPNWRLPPEHESQPQIIQLACLLTDDDGTERAMAHMLVQPTRRDIPEDVSRIHGITTEIATKFGMTAETALGLWRRFAQSADRVVAHNVRFDKQMVEIAYAHGRDYTPAQCEMIRAVRWECTMEAAAPLVNLPPTARMTAAGMTKPKPPRLEECIRHFFGEDLEGAHDALVDVRACARVYFHMRGLSPQETT